MPRWNTLSFSLSIRAESAYLLLCHRGTIDEPHHTGCLSLLLLSSLP